MTKRSIHKTFIILKLAVLTTVLPTIVRANDPNNSIKTDNKVSLAWE